MLEVVRHGPMLGDHTIFDKQSVVWQYAGKDPNTINLTPFPKTPLPNWRLDYAGLNKIPKMAEIFSSVNITHSYTSTYDVIGFTASGQYLDPE